MLRKRIILVYPFQGFSGTYVKHMPLGLLYTAADLAKEDFDIQILDTRVAGNWQNRLRSLINDETLCVGISVMSGSPIKHAIEIGRLVKSLSPDIPVVWGGPHATFYPDTIVRDEWSCDYVVSGYANKPFYALCKALQLRARPTGIPDISWRDPDGSIHSNYTGQTEFEYIDWKDIPYQLITDYSPYGQLDQDKRIFSMYSAYGCPYQCSFCSSPAQYSTIKGKRWVPLSAANIVDHVQHVVEKYDANYIYFIDDDSFPKLDHVGSIIDEIKARQLPVGLGFRGARINEIKRMSHEFLDRLAAAGTDIMHIGAESGSDRVLQVIRKDCTAQEIIDCNRKLAQHPTITAAYNFMMGVPTETLAELKQTRDLMLQLVDDNPSCIVFPPNKFRPLPGTELYKIAEATWGYKMPNTLEAWSNIEVEGDISDQWYEKGMSQFCNLMLICSYFIDNKVSKVTKGKTIFLRAMRLINLLYRPIARFRLKHGITFGLVEYHTYRLMTRVVVRLQRMINNRVTQS